MRREAIDATEAYSPDGHLMRREAIDDHRQRSGLSVDDDDDDRQLPGLEEPWEPPHTPLLDEEDLDRAVDEDEGPDQDVLIPRPPAGEQLAALSVGADGRIDPRRRGQAAAAREADDDLASLVAGAGAGEGAREGAGGEEGGEGEEDGEGEYTEEWTHGGRAQDEADEEDKAYRDALAHLKALGDEQGDEEEEAPPGGDLPAASLAAISDGAGGGGAASSDEDDAILLPSDAAAAAALQDDATPPPSAAAAAAAAWSTNPKKDHSNSSPAKWNSNRTLFSLSSWESNGSWWPNASVSSAVAYATGDYKEDNASDAADALAAPLNTEPEKPEDLKTDRDSYKVFQKALSMQFVTAIVLGLAGFCAAKQAGANASASRDAAAASGSGGAGAGGQAPAPAADGGGGEGGQAEEKPKEPAKEAEEKPKEPPKEGSTDPAAGSSGAAALTEGAAPAEREPPQPEPVEINEPGKACYTVIPNKVRYAYCLPTVATLPVTALIAVFGLSFYSRRNADLPTMALAVALARSCDVVSDPVMSYLTDSCRHAAGRRKPWILIGAPLYGLFLYNLLHPPWLSSTPLAGWFAIMYICFFLTNTLANIPYDAWGPELTEDSAERARLFFLSGLFDGGGTLAAFAMPFAGVKVAKYFELTKEICVPRDSLVEKCSSGLSCGLFEENGPGYEFAVNSSFVHTMSGFHNKLLEYDCDDQGAGIEGMAEQAVATFCNCMMTCQQSCASANRSWGFAFTGAIFAIWFLVSQYHACFVVKERPPPEGGYRRTAPLVPSMLNTLKNPAFTALLPAWAFDAVSAAIFLSLCPYYVMYVIAPEYQNEGDSPFALDCKEGARGISTSLHYDRRCSTMVILGIGVGSALLCAVLTTPIWLAMVKKLGKVKMWLIWSLAMAATNFLFTAMDKSDVRSVIIVCGLNGIPIAAKFLADAILADIIDYDEFLQGARNEATYTMFKSFLPKVMAIPAAALPLSVMNYMGHIPVVQGKIMWQPHSVRWSIKAMAGAGSGIAALCAWWIKRRYQLKTDEIVQKIADGVKLQKQGKAAEDPITGEMYLFTTYTDEENTTGVWDLDHFLGVEVIKSIADDPAAGLAALAAKAGSQFGKALFLFAACIGGLIYSVPWLQDRKWSVVPTLFAVGLGTSVVLCGFCFFRWKAAGRLKNTPPKPELVNKVLEQRNLLQKLEDVRKGKTGEAGGGGEAPAAGAAEGGSGAGPGAAATDASATPAAPGADSSAPGAAASDAAAAS